MASLGQRLTKAFDARARKGASLGPYDIEIERDLRVPMDDGVELLADLIRPVGEVDPALPTIVIRGPYGRRGGVAGSARALAYDGFTVLFQSCRGTWGSPGVFTPQIDEQRDGIATHGWVRRQPWFTGSVATYGASYMGYTQWAVAGRLQQDEPETAPDALVLITTMPDFGAITWDDGAFSLRNALGWTRMMDRMARGGAALLGMLFPDPKLTKAFDVLPLSAGDTAATGAPNHWYQDWVRHENLSDEYWTQQNHEPTVRDVTAPVYMISGWYDIFLPWQLRNYRRLVEAGNAPQLTLGPWGHVSPGMGAPLHTESIAFLRETFTGVSSERAAPVRAYLTGEGLAEAERWQGLPEWPPADADPVDWMLHADKTLSRDAASRCVTSYTFDPSDPTPTAGGPSLERDTTPKDNRVHERRDDVVVFRSEPVSDAVTVAGEPVATVRIRSTAPSFDVFVRLTDIHPDGTAMTVCDGIRRIGSVGTAATDPDADAEGFRDVEVRLWPTFHRFAPGHRIGVQVSSGSHPRYAANPGIAEPAFTAADRVVAVQEISHGASRLSLPTRSA